MANLTRIPGIDDFETQLSSSYNGGLGTVSVNSVPSGTIESGETSYIVINPGKSNMQVVEIDGWNSGTSSFNVVSITVEKGNGVNYSAQTHAANSIVRFSNNYAFWKDIRTAVNSKAEVAAPTFTGYVGLPEYVDDATRDAAIPSPTGKELIILNGDIQHYNSTTLQRETADVGTPTPNASTTVAGKVEKSTPAQVTAGTATGETGAELFVGPAELKTVTDRASSPEALFEKDEYIAGETILANDSLFVESLPTFAESTVVQNIGDVTGNTRVSILGFGSGVASNILRLSLIKFVSPSANLSVRIETVSGGNPTGTLVDANATATVTAASLTTSLVDTTITLAGSITITKGQQVAIVLSQVGDVVNATNYYGVGYVARDTSTRPSKLWNGSAWLTYISNIINNNLGVLNTTSAAQPTPIGVTITSKTNGFIKKVIKDSLCTATTAEVRSSTGVFIASATFVGDVATFTGAAIATSTNYRILVGTVSGTYNARYVLTSSYPYINTSLDYINCAIGSGANNFGGTTTNTTELYNIINIETNINDIVVPMSFNYTSSTLFENRVLSETNASFSYKLPTDYPRIATQGYTIGQSVTSKYYGLHNYPGLVANTAYYVANTAGAISAVAGSNVYNIGKTDGNGTLKIDGKVLNKSITVSASPFSYTNTTGGPIQVSITGGTVNPIVINGVTTATATNHINTLPAGATMTVTYTVLPTIVYSDL